MEYAGGVTFIFTVADEEAGADGRMSTVIRAIKSPENMCHCPDYFFRSPTQQTQPYHFLSEESQESGRWVEKVQEKRWLLNAST